MALCKAAVMHSQLPAAGYMQQTQSLHLLRCTGVSELNRRVPAQTWGTWPLSGRSW